MGQNKNISEIKQKKWICVQITHRYNKSEHVKTVKDFLHSVFSKSKILFVGKDLGDNNFKNALDGYFFIECDDARKYIDVFKNSKYINNILISYENIVYISDKQIQTMVGDYEAKLLAEIHTYKIGDVIKVKTGMFKNLYGVVINAEKHDELTIVLKFISGYRFQTVKVENCEPFQNFFDLVREPVL